MESDDDFVAPSQFRTQQRSNSTNRSQAVTSSSMQPGSQVGPSQGSQVHLTQIRDGLKFLMDRVQQLSGDSRGIKRPAEAKPFDMIPNTKEKCQICHKLYANKTTLFRHYRAMHQEMNPEKYHGCSVNSNVVSLDASFREIQCSICSYVAPNQSAFDAHNKTTHNNVVNANSNAVAANVSNKENVNIVNVKDKMHKCEECACYFEERSKFDEHMKVLHGFEVVCKICNKNFLFKDIDGHVKDSHPDVYTKKHKENKREEKVIVEKVMKNKKGNRVHVFICVKCDTKIFDKIEADKHARGHKKGLKIKAPRNKVSKTDEIKNVSVDDDDNVILTCLDCDISTGSYDAAVEHAQIHLTKKSDEPQFVTQLCDICDLKFEPLCYKKHIDLHYKNKEIHRESFKYFKYMFELLLTENWFNCFDMSEPVVKKMVSESIYAHTRSVKMRVDVDGSFTLYKCCKCDDFVEPAAVVNHTVNYDTCIKVRCSYPCKICKRTFNNRLARNNHANDHKNEEAYKIVLFNHENDKKFNEVLNDPKLRLNNQVRGCATNRDPNHTKILYKCLCELCFVRKQTADDHKKICPGRDAKKLCKICGNSFIQEELLAHRFEHHLNEKPIVIENVIPDVIELDSDDEDNLNEDPNVIVIDSSDEEDTHNQCFDNVTRELLKAGGATAIQLSTDNEEPLKVNVPETLATDAGRNNEELPVQAHLLVVRKIERDENSMDEDEDKTDNDFGEVNNALTSDDSQDTIAYKNPEADTNNQGEFKLVPTRLLLNPLHEENRFLNVLDIATLNAEINRNIESIRQNTETTNDGPLNENAIKKENSWLFDPTDFSNICKRPSLRQIDMQPSLNNLILKVESLLTDDEETGINSENEEEDRRVNDNDTNNRSNNEPTIVEQLSHETDDMFNETLQIDNHNDITQNIDKVRDENNDNESNERDGCEANHSAETINQEVDNNGDNQYYSDDDLFVPSGIDTRERTLNNEKVTSIVTAEKDNHEQDLCNDKEASAEESETAFESILTNEAECGDVNNTETENDEYAVVNSGNNTSPREIDNNTTERENEDTDTVEVENDTQMGTTNDFIQPKIVSKENQPEKQERDADFIRNTKKEFKHMNINIKRELIADNENEKNGCYTNDLVQVKTEPNDLEAESDDKENDCVVNDNADDDNNNCSIM